MRPHGVSVAMAVTGHNDVRLRMYKGRREHLVGMEHRWPTTRKTIPIAVSMEDNTFKLIEYWKRHSPRPEEQVPFSSITKGLGTPYSAVELKEEAVGRWGVSSPMLVVGHRIMIQSFTFGENVKLLNSVSLE